MVFVSSYISITTLNVSGLNAPINGTEYIHLVDGWIQI